MISILFAEVPTTQALSVSIGVCPSQVSSFLFYFCAFDMFVKLHSFLYSLFFAFVPLVSNYCNKIRLI